jgi:leader peptidase (prepilin peptidase)/N-methyltransferase
MPVPAAYLFAGLIGTIAGSFIGLVADRWPRGESIAAGRSHCTACQHQLHALQLIPIVSFCVQRARCRHCRAALPIDLLLAEIGGGGAAMLALACGESWPGMAALALFGWALVLLALLDARQLWLPDAVTIPLCLAGLASAAVLPALSLPERGTGAAAGFLSLEVLRRAYRWLRGREGLGGGDPKLLAAIGAWLGAPALPIIVLSAALLGLGWAGVLHFRKAGINQTTQLPLGTLLAFAAFCAVPFVYPAINLA